MCLSLPERTDTPWCESLRVRQDRLGALHCWHPCSPSNLPAWLMSADADRFAAEHEGARVAEIELVGDDDGVVVVGDRSA